MQDKVLYSYLHGVPSQIRSSTVKNHSITVFYGLNLFENLIKKSTYLHFIRLSVFLALLGLSLDNIISYTYSDFAHMNFELFDHVDTDGEEETEKDKEQEEKDEKVQVNNFAINTPSSNNLINLMLANQLYSIPHREIQIPPPKKA